jgi:excisionase family DNA binding protein
MTTAAEVVRSEILTVGEAAEYLRMSSHWVYKRTADGSLPCLRVGRAVRFRRSDLDSWLSTQQR